MRVEPSSRIGDIGSYAFSDLDNQVAKLRDSGVTPVDFGVGDPKDPPFPSVVEQTIRSLHSELTSGYPSYVGHPRFREEAAAFVEARFGRPIDPETEIISSVGSKEMVFNFHEGFVNPGDTVIVPNPAYPPYIRGTLFAEGNPYYVNLLEENRFLPDLDAIPSAVWDAAKIIWVNYPNNPTTVFAPDEFFDKLIYYAHKHDVVIGSDAAYSENFCAQRPRSILEFTKEGAVALFSFSKMANMTMFRAGFVCGDSRIIDVLKKLKTNIDSGTPTFIQLGALAALTDEPSLAAMRQAHVDKADVLCAALERAGFPPAYREGTIYIWQKCPEGHDGLEVARRFLQPDLGLVATPGVMLSLEVGGVNPGADFLRFALTPTLEQVKVAATRLEGVRF